MLSQSAGSILIKNANVVNEGQVVTRDVRIVGQLIDKIATEITALPTDTVIDAQGKFLLPGMIDDQVHFREPGLTHKGSILSESRAAVAGGITSYMEMPNVTPATTTIEALESKFAIAEANSLANYSFYLGASEDNLDEIKKLDPSKHCGIKVFMGASTGDLLVEAPQALDNIFLEAPSLIVTHCESTPVIQNNLQEYHRRGQVPTIHDHPLIRDTDACFASSSYAVDLAKRFNSQLHVLHITTEKELGLFAPGPIQGKNITAEACVHHLWFCKDDYSRLGNLIKCNPAIKNASDRDAIVNALHDGRIDIIATDHAPHTWDEKQVDYNKAPAGLPLVQHALLSLLDQVKHGNLSIAQVVEKTAHNPAIRYNIKQRGYIREGYYADLVLVDCESDTAVSHDNCLYQCGWTPFDGHTFSSKITSTWVNGTQVFDGVKPITSSLPSHRLAFDR